MLRATARKLGLGRAWLRATQLWNLGLAEAAAIRRAKRRYPRLILEAMPMRADRGMEVHMLLHKPRLLDGLWGLYSLGRFSEEGIRAVIHNDGSLDRGDVEAIRRVLPGARVVERAEGDAKVRHRLGTAGLNRCARLRDSLVLSLKLFDPFLFLESDEFLILDSDVVFFSRPSDLLGTAGGPPRYMVDNSDVYCLSNGEMERFLGRPCVPRLNSGLMWVRRRSVDFARVEKFLEAPGFWTGPHTYFGEMTLWAMELTLDGALPLSPGYGIAPTAFGDTSLVAGHYCGGGRWSGMLYTGAMPFLAPRLGLTV